MSASIQSQLRRGGYRGTPQRLLILGLINSLEEHFTPQELHSKLRACCPEIGVVTVYRTLKLLAALGWVCEIERSRHARRYTLCPPEHHHQLICAGCARVVDFNHCELDGLSRCLGRETGFNINGHSLEFTGLCTVCRQNKTEPV